MTHCIPVEYPECCTPHGRWQVQVRQRFWGRADGSGYWDVGPVWRWVP